MSTTSLQPFEPSAYRVFHYVSRVIDADGTITLTYSLDGQVTFSERIELPISGPVTDADRAHVDGLLSLLHWIAGVSYFKCAAPLEVSCNHDIPGPATKALLEALYSEGLGEFAYTNGLARLPRPAFPSAPCVRAPTANSVDNEHRLLIPVGGGKDSIVALEIARRARCDIGLFSVGNAAPAARTARVADLPHLIATRHLDQGLSLLNRSGALNGHIPVTAIVSCVALLTAALNGYDAVVFANERSASHGNLIWNGVEINHQFSKSRRAETLFRSALLETGAGVDLFSILRPASELAIARAFAQMTGYHSAFTSCNTVFRLDPKRRNSSWCCDCPKCRFVFLILAPFLAPAILRDLFGSDMLCDERQFDGFAALIAADTHKPFECVGEEIESLAAIRMLAADPRWRDHPVVRRLVQDVLPKAPTTLTKDLLSLSEDHDVPSYLMTHVRSVLAT